MDFNETLTASTSRSGGQPVEVTNKTDEPQLTHRDLTDDYVGSALARNRKSCANLTELVKKSGADCLKLKF